MSLLIDEVLKSATLATSIDNCQPWIFSVKDKTIEMYLDSERAEFFGDADRTASYVTFGAVVENMTIAANHLGFSVLPEYFPRNGENLIARVKFVKGGKEDSPLFKYLPLRCTNRRIFKKKPVPADILEDVMNCAKDISGASVNLVSDRKTIKRLAHLAEKTDRIIFSHRLLHEGLFKWIRWTQNEIDKTMDGIPVSALELNKLQQKAFKLISSWKTLNVLNKFGINRAVSSYSYKSMKSAGSVGLITMDGNSPEDYINGGRAFERVWLTAVSRGLAFQPMGGIVFLTTKFRLAGGKGFSQKQQRSLEEIFSSLCDIYPIKKSNAVIILFRMGYAEPPSGRALRRPVSEVIKTF